MKEECFNSQIEPVTVPQRKGEPYLFDTDEHPLPNLTAKGSAALSPAFIKVGTVYRVLQ